MKNDKFVYVTYINTTPEKLWEALTNTDFMKLYWFGSSFETDWKIGSSIKETMQNGKPGFEGEILKFDPPRLLSYSFFVKDEEKTKVTFEISKQGEAVKLTTIHEGYERGTKEYESTGEGWAVILSGIKSLLETGKPLALDLWSQVNVINSQNA
ncbi:MAG: SRPBCC family protein [Pyrinomonadaceae bacterium]